MFAAFGIRRSVSRPGNPYDNVAAGPTNRILKCELVHDRVFASEERLRTEFFDWTG